MHLMPPLILNALSIDVEDYFQVSMFESHISRDSWDQQPPRLEANLETLLVALEQHQACATFFVLGWIAKRYPQLIQRIAHNGHEIASHGFNHTRVYQQNAAEFLNDIQSTRALLEDTVAQPVLGYRAASFSINTQTPWAHDCIEQAGYQYSSSIYPIAHDHYGAPNAPRFVYKPTTHLKEIPISTVRLGAKNWPTGGGGFFRLLPYAYTRWCLRRLNQHDQKPAVFYLHPWEIDPKQPRIATLPWQTRFRHYVNLDKTLPKLCRLLQDFKWQSLQKVFL